MNSSSKWVVALLLGTAAWGQIGPVKVATGTGHGVLLKADGSVWTWGEDAGEPERVPGLSGVRDVAAGDQFTVAVRNDGTVWTWGESEHAAPMQVAGLGGVAAVAACGPHTLALKSDGTVWEWDDDPAAPKQVPGLTDAVAIATGERNRVVLKRDGTVWVWGYHGAGDLGNGNYGLSAVPLPLRGLSEVTAVAAGYDLTVAVKKDGTVWALGYGAAGQLGNGSSENSLKWVQAAGLAGVKAVAAGAMHVLALKNDGTVWSWGSNHSRQLGNPRVTDEQSAKPVRAGTLTGAVAIAAATNHSVAVTGDGVAWAWGQNDGDVLGADHEVLERSDVPMRVGQEVPAACDPLFACVTGGGKVIRICGEQDPANNDKWSAIQYRFGPEYGPPELAFPADPAAARPSLFFSHDERKGDYRVSVRFSNGAYTYRVYSGSSSGAGVDVEDAKGKVLFDVACAERPSIFPEYLRLSLPCDAQNPHGALACRKEPYRGK